MQAYLIIAHKNLEQLKKLLKLLDYSKNDLYIHIDKKAEKEIIEFDFSKCCKYSKVYKFFEYSVNWGSENVINCELFLLKKANENKKYEYYHLISGADLPLKGAKEIYAAIAHPVLSGPAIERIQNSDIKKLICTDTIKLPKEKQIDKIEVVSISDMLADIIHANNVGESVTAVVRKYRDLDYTDK